MDFQWDAEQRAFRDTVRSFLAENLPADWESLAHGPGSESQSAFSKTFCGALAKAGLLVPHWPKRWGGRDADAWTSFILAEEMWMAGEPRGGQYMNVNWIGPTLMRFGTEAQQDRYIPPIARGETIWCQGFSEPDHGSDLGAVQTRAVRDGDDYVVNGSKIWTTLGNYADHMILLARTNTNTERKYDGLSFFLSPMKIDGVKAHPIRKVTGEYGFNQTFFTDARIPASCLMGEEGGGWMVAMKTLEYERGVTAGQASGYWGVTIQVDDMIEALSKLEHDGEPLLSDPVVRDDLVGFIMEAKAISLTGRRSGIPALTSDYPMGLALSVKYRGTEYERRMKQYTASKQGAQSALYVGDADAVSGGFWQRAYFSNFGATIGGGTTQVQANIVAEHVLGLPK